MVSASKLLTIEAKFRHTLTFGAPSLPCGLTSAARLFGCGGLDDSGDAALVDMMLAPYDAGEMSCSKKMSTSNVEAQVMA